uniref:helix-turn-helix transcriptional regulator n=1 Tax=Phocaeicola vulgatus TaxID=821 RepID=UPI004027E200
MPANKNALLRYKTIDNCLRNRQRRWTLQDLVDACSDALYDFEGIRKGISTRSVQLDIQMMRSDKLGYNAPIEVYDHKYYRYSAPNFSITELPLSQTDYDKLAEAVDMLRQYADFDYFTEMSDVIGRLQDTLAIAKNNRAPIVAFERNSNLMGLKFLNPLYNYIANKQTLTISYQPFNNPKPKNWVVWPYLLKEYRNRWFLFCTRVADHKLFNLALDRMKSIEPTKEIPFQEDSHFDPSTFFKDVIGVTKTRKTPLETVRFIANSEQAPYIETKPVHSSQMVLERNDEDGTVLFQCKVVLNFEFYALMLSYGPGVKIISPKCAVRTIRKMLNVAAEQYNPKNNL